MSIRIFRKSSKDMSKKTTNATDSKQNLEFKELSEDIQKVINHTLEAPIFKIISECSENLQLETYLIGGYVRDLILGRPTKDIDVVTIGSGILLATSLQNELGKKATLSVFKNFGTAQVKFKSYELDFVGARKESYRKDSRKPIVEDGTLSDDLARRDLTINALAISLNKKNYGRLIDPYNGLNDMTQKLIKTPLDPDTTFDDDPLRMMRAIRFATQLGYKIAPATLSSISKNSERLKIISVERATEEFKKIILSDNPSYGVNIMMETGLLNIYLPELVKLKGAETKDGVGHKENFSHSLKVMDNIAKHTDDLFLRLAALFHDIAKPKTKKYVEGIGWTFHNHNIEGSRMIPKIFKRIKLPLDDRMKYVQKLVYLHMRPSQLADEGVTDSAIRRLLFDAGDDIEDLMLLCEADITSKNPKKVERYLNNFKIVRQKLIDVEEKDRIRNFQPPISGEIIMNTFGLTPCKEVGLIKDSIKDAILDGIIKNNFDDAYRYMLSVAKTYGFSPKS